MLFCYGSPSKLRYGQMIKNYEGSRKGSDYLKIPSGQGFLKQRLYTTCIRNTYDAFYKAGPQAPLDLEF